MIVLACEDGRLVKWLSGAGTPPASVKAHEGPVRCVRFTPDGAFALSSGDDKAVKLWDLGTDQCLWTVEDQKEAVNAACFAPDARRVIFAGRSGLRAWELDWKFEFPDRDEAAGKAAPVAPRISVGQEDQSSKAKTVRYVLAGLGLSAVIGLVLYLAVTPDKAPVPSPGTAFESRPKPSSAEGGEPAPAPEESASLRV